MAAIYRFGFEGGLVPSGVTCGTISNVSGITSYGTSACTGFCTCELSAESAVKGSFGLYLGSLVFPMTLVTVGNTVMRVKTQNSIDVLVDGSTVAELTIPAVAASNWYDVRFCYVSGSAGNIIWEWDGNDLTYDASVSEPLSGNLQSVTLCESLGNHYLDNVALNNDKDGIDDAVPAMTASYSAIPVSVGNTCDWSVFPEGSTPVNAVVSASSDNYLYASTGGAVANFVLASASSGITKTAFEGLRISYRNIRRVGTSYDHSLNIGYRSGNENTSIKTVSSIGYGSITKDVQIFYRSGGEKFSVSDGELIQTYFEIV